MKKIQIKAFSYHPSISNLQRVPPGRPVSVQTQRLRTVATQITREIPYYGFVDTETRELSPFVEIAPQQTYTFLYPEGPIVPPNEVALQPAQIAMGEVLPVEGLPANAVPLTTANLSAPIAVPSAPVAYPEIPNPVAVAMPVENSVIADPIPARVEQLVHPQCGSPNGVPPNPLPYISLVPPSKSYLGQETQIRWGGPGGGGSGGGDGWGLSGSGSFGPDPKNSLLFYLFGLSLFLAVLAWLSSWALDKFRRILEKYKETQDAWLELQKKDPTKLEKWLEKNRFNQLTDLMVAFTTLIFAPSLLSYALKNISNKWSKALLSLIVPLTRLCAIIAFFMGSSFVSLKSLSWLSIRLQPYLEALLQWFSLGSVYPPVTFMELVLKCVVAGLLAGIICRNFFQWHPQDRQQNLTAVSATACCGLGIYFVAKDTFYFCQIATKIWKTEVGTFFLKSVLGRTSILIGCTKALSNIEELPYTMYFYFFFVCVFQVYSLAFTATPNIF